jgi:hypothetical protein
MGDHPLRDAIEAVPGTLASKLILSPKRDPFQLDKPRGHRDGQWLTDKIAELGIRLPLHLRGLHYALIGQPKPNGEPYTNTEKDWQWLNDFPAKCARWLGYIPFDQIIDERNDEPTVVDYQPPFGRYRGMSVPNEFKLPDDVTPYPYVGGLDPGQPYHLVLVSEKTSPGPVLRPIAANYGADLYLETGDLSDTHIYRMARSGAADGRPMVVFYFGDSDPSGWNMPIVLAWKLSAHKVREFPDLEFQVHRAALTPDQVRQYGLPSTPLKATELRADAWYRAMGVEQTEIDALATLQPDRLREIAEDATAPFYDTTLYWRVRTADQEWTAQAREAIAAQADEHGWDDANAELADISDRLTELLAAARADTDGIDLPPIPDQLEPDLDDDDQPEPLCDSRWDLAEQVERLRASKMYEADA